MPYQPTFPKPYLTSIDVNRPETCVLSCVINPRDEIVEYYVNIYEVESGLSLGFIKGESSDDGYKKSVYYKESPFETVYTFGTGGTDYVQIQSSEYDTRLPLTDSTLTIAIPDEIVLLMSNDGKYAWKIGLVTSTNNMNKLNSFVLDYDHDGSNDSGEIVVNQVFDDGFFYDFCNKVYVKHKGRYYLVNFFSHNTYTDKMHIHTYDDFSHKVSDVIEICTPMVISQDFYFYALSTPALEFINPPDVIKSFSHTFNASYSADSNQKINYFIFRLYSNGILIDDTDKVYSSNIRYAYDKFEREKTYELELEVEDEYGNLESISHSFHVEYPINTIPVEPKASCDGSGFVNIDYSGLISVEGYGENFEYIDEESISIAKDGYVMWDKTGGSKNIQIPYDSTTILKVHFHNIFKGDIFSIYSSENIGDRIRIWFEDGYFCWQSGYSDPTSIFAYETEESAIKDTSSLDSGTIVVSDDVRYIIDSDDEIEAIDDITIIANDTLSHYWWYIVVRPSATNSIVKIIRGEAY